MDTAPFPKCPKCRGTNNKLINVHNLHDDPSDCTEVTAKVYAFTCQGCGLSFTEEVKVAGESPRQPAA